MGRDDFILGASNRDAFSLLDRWPDWPSHVVVLIGPAGSGKTHLARMWAGKAGAEYLSPADLAARSISALPRHAGLAVDGIDPDNVPEQALFHLLNAAREAGASVLLTSRAAPGLWRMGVPDLYSRLRLAAPVSLGLPDDLLLRQVMVKLFTDRQVEVERTVIDYLVRRLERSLAAAAAAVEALDVRALSEHRPVTRALAADMLKDEGGDEV